MNNFALRAGVLACLLGMVGVGFAKAETTGSQTRNTVAKVRTDSGVVMLSSDNQAFATAGQNAPVVAGDRVMVAADSIATVVYDNGCEEKYEKAGVYVIDSDCNPAAFWTRGRVIAAAVGGAAVVGVVIHNRDDDKDVPPVSQ